ncbi:FAD-dependent oxidoreductase [Nonomuraea muscovyensis]|uniref:Succinate dehydrogenase/fumarate reductase flavoprotein subunit n=1 Tax=Nonomuraea muscovyensis TaxID=1124761 RepID=A0A7X0C431_9ACTN|nr:FAD-dependent oxidoreductase [Nonomuraea muscovyensis]MBB6347798.1 succinate dehydrogenase/fumarate reductase flavoprotein subunit [Nonomuraea muscovyensis]MDF2704670.1 kstD [Nonomuraea muscovyensis]
MTINNAYDIVVAGSGAAGLTAALAAAAGGASVVVLEAADRWGGTSGISGGAVWVPVNHRSAGDSADDALAYCARHAPGRDPELVRAFVEAAPRMARFVEEHSPITFTAMRYPDTFAETPGGRAAGRHLEVAPLKVGALGPWNELVWPMPYPSVLTNDEVFGGGVHGGGALPYELLQRRMAADEVTMGLGLVVGLLHGCRAAGVELVRGARVRELVQSSDGTVTGVVAEVGGERREIAARRGVVLANGGFEADTGLSRRQLGSPAPVPLAPPVNDGDALRMALAAGAEPAHLGESWCWPAVQVPGETWELAPGVPRPRMVVSERTMPHVLWVNQHGRRFVNEATHNCCLALAETDPSTHQPRNGPAWAVGDAQFRERYAVAGVAPGQPAPDWLITADSLAELAGLLGVDAKALEETAARFNAGAREGHDPDFGRGESVYDRYTGDPMAPHPTLGTVEVPPFFALPLHRGTIATKGGARTDGAARVLRWDDTPVPGCFAAGTAAAALFGPGAIANGMHLSFAMTWGWLAGTTAAGRR